MTTVFASITGRAGTRSRLLILTAGLALLAGCGGDDEQSPDRPAAGQGAESSRSQPSPPEQNRTETSEGESSPERAEGSGGERSQESGAEGGAPESSGGDRATEGRERQESGRRRGQTDSGQGNGSTEFFGGVEVEPVEPGSSDCRVEANGRSSTVPCEAMKGFLGRRP